MLSYARHATLLPGLFRQRAEVDKEYLLSLDTTCLLQNFYFEAGIQLPGQQSVSDPAAVKLHWGWEAPSCQLRGHFLGHWMSAAAAFLRDEEDRGLHAKLENIVDELARCQQLNGGEWVGSIPEKYFDILMHGSYIWSPQYTMHKTLMGLKDTYAFTGNETALRVVSALADWYVRWTAKAKEIAPAAIFGGEQAGMLEVWADLYLLTGDPKYLSLAETYSGQELFARLERGTDALTDEHANASIPISHGAARMYEATGDEKWLRLLEDFWKCAVTERGMFATTGSNAGEFWIPPYRHASHTTDRTQEFCTVYNMVRTANELLRFTGKKEYADYIERALYNGFLAQQNPYTGMPTYFLPQHAGSRKTWGSKTHDFWCCHGTMVQSPTLYTRLIAYEESDRVYVEQYIPSRCEMTGLSLEMRMDMKNTDTQVLFDERAGGEKSRWCFTLSLKGDGSEKALMLRVPDWSKGTPSVTLNSVPVSPVIENGYLVLRGKWTEDLLKLRFTAAVQAEPLAGSEDMVSLLEGPIVLAALTDEDRGLPGNAEHPEEQLINETERTYSTFIWQQSHYRTRFARPNYRLIPLYEVVDEPYTLYLTVDGQKGSDD